MAMRLAAQAKMGFYPVKPETINLICRSLKTEDPSKTFILDPCCGEGRALGQLGELLKVPHEQRYGVELDAGRAATAAEYGNVLHSSFFGARIVPVNAFSLVWCNPPYEDEIKQADSSGSRQLEIAFIQAVARLVTPNGVIIVHCPADRITPQMMTTFYSVAYQPCIVELPADLMPYREALLVGVKRPKPERETYLRDLRRVGTMPELVVPVGNPVKKFYQEDPTDEEIIESLETASFMRVFTHKVKPPKLRPVMPLGPGHLGLTLASGLLDGLLQPQGYEPHVVRGIAFKESQIAKTERETNPETGKVTVTETHRENIKLKLRILTSSGAMIEKL